jgi:hypothetical protein
MVIKNGKSPATKRKAATSSAKQRRSPAVSKSSANDKNIVESDKLDGIIDRNESTPLESEAGDPVVEETGIDSGIGGNDLPSESTQLKEVIAITLHQPWASLIAAGRKQYETRDWPTDYRGLIAIHAGRKPKNKQELQEHQEIVESFSDLLNGECPYSGIVAIATMTDCIRMTEEFIELQSSTELRCGGWVAGRYAFKLEDIRTIEPIAAVGKQGLWKWNINEKEKDSRTLELRKRFFELLLVHRDASAISKIDELKPWNPAEFGDLHHVAEADGQLNLLDWTDKEPPEPDDYSSIELFDQAYKKWADAQEDEAEEELANFGENELREQLVFNSREKYELATGNDSSELSEEECEELLKEKLCNRSNNGNGSTCAAELAQDSPTLELNCGEKAQTNSVNQTTTATKFSDSDILIEQSGLTSNFLDSTEGAGSDSQNLLQLPLPAPLSQSMEKGWEPTIQETVLGTCLEQSEDCSLTSQSSKTLQDSLLAPIPQATNPEVISLTSSTPYRQTGTMRNGSVSGVMNSPLRGVGKEFLLLRSPGALSSSGKASPPGKTRLENQLQELNLISASEVVAPEFLELGYRLPIGFTNPAENRSAMELSQVQAQQLPIDPKSELQAETETTAIAVQPSAMPWTGELQPSDSNESSTLIQLPANVGALSKDELLASAIEQHNFITNIERTEFELGVEKLHRARLTGIYFQELKKRCRHGEFESELEKSGIKPRRAQEYMSIAKNWEAIETEAKARLGALLSEENQSLGIKWALDVVSQKRLKSAAPPADPDCWRTPNTAEQPIVDLVKQALGGQIWCDPCADAGQKIPAAVHYSKFEDGLKESQVWSKTVFINPPFSDPLPWVEKCCLSIARGNVSAAIMLLKSGTVSNIGTGELISKYASAVCHWRGRINFLNDEGKPVKGSDFDCVLVYFGDQLDLFRSAFGGRGTISTIDNYYSSVNKKHLTNSSSSPEPNFNSIKAEEKQLAAAVGLSNGKSGVLPDRRDFDRELMERYDPHTTIEVPQVSRNLVEEFRSPQIFEETESIVAEFEEAKANCLNDYVTAISGNLSDFSDEQIAFLVKILNEESAKRIGF